YLWKPRTKSVAVFKNGFGFFMADAESALREGWCTAASVPPAAFGTLAVYAITEGQTVDVVGAGPGEVVEFDDKDAPATLGERKRRIEASKSLKVALTYSYCNQERQSAGKVVSVADDYVVLESDGQNFAVATKDVKRMQMLDLPVRVHVSADAGNAAAKAAASQRANLGMAYLRQGITWIPAYTLRVIDDDTCELTLRGTIVNEAEDIIHADVQLVVGVPHFLHSDHMEPLAVGQAIRTIGAAVVPAQLQSQIANNSIAFSNFDNRRGGDVVGEARPIAPQQGGNLAAAAGNVPQMESPAGGSDFTVYTRKDLTLRRGEKAVVTLFVKKLKYSHLYKWSPPGPLEHFLQIQNDNAGALTTGPCLAISGNQPLSEDVLKYVPKNGKGQFPITTAVNIITDVIETEADRKLKAYSPGDKVNLDLVTIKGELRLRNFEQTAAQIQITHRITGKPQSASDGGVIAADPSKLTLREREGTIKWTVELKTGESKTLMYEYERYVPSN
ncbi:MAG TPA: hypothetical protein VLJ39_20010, partial [Tepidisphaeraceae bacterium]|nr:hypothetical protein [Tepidisphaeraceae bacterium]